jgi:glycogen operon protein
MLLAGDEMGRTQSGNNNAYCQDNEISWVDWENWSGEDVEFLEFVRRLLRIRRDHPVFRQPRFFHGRTRRDALLRDITWLGSDGCEISEADWSDASARSLGVHFPDVRAEDRGGARRGASDVHFLLLFNSSPDPLSFKLPPPVLDEPWQLLLDTARSGAEEDQVDLPFGGVYPLLGRSLALLQTTPTRRSSAADRR